MKILKAFVVEAMCGGPDTIILETDLPSPEYDNQPLRLFINAKAGTAVEFVKTHFELEVKLV